MSDFTTIRVSKETHKLLFDACPKGKSMDDIIVELISKRKTDLKPGDKNPFKPEV